jgi:Domain of unknown function (4846)
MTLRTVSLDRTRVAGLFCLMAVAQVACGDAPPRTDAPRRRAEQPRANLTDAPDRADTARHRSPPRSAEPANGAAVPPVARRPAPARTVVPTPTIAEAAKRYPWKRQRAGYESLATRFPAPAGFARVHVKAGSYADWLRHLPMRVAGTVVRDYAGRRLAGATAAAVAVMDLDVGRRDLQQCMDTLMRLRGEYWWWKKKAGRTRFRYAGGKYFGWAQYARGIRPKRQGRRIVYKTGYRAGYGRKHFRRYLTFMFMMTGTVHNTREPRVKFADLAAGSFFVHPPPSPGSLGHAVTILDVAKGATGQIRILIGEGYTPAQDFHVLRAPGGGAWYKASASSPVQTPQWPVPFKWTQLRRFKY